MIHCIWHLRSSNIVIAIFYPSEVYFLWYLCILWYICHSKHLKFHFDIWSNEKIMTGWGQLQTGSSLDPMKREGLPKGLSIEYIHHSIWKCACLTNLVKFSPPTPRGGVLCATMDDVTSWWMVRFISTALARDQVVSWHRFRQQYVVFLELLKCIVCFIGWCYG